MNTPEGPVLPELLPCECGRPINENFQIQHVFASGRDNVFVARCSYCGLVISFTADSVETMNDVSAKAIAAWNQRAQEGQKP
jgi:hypothetical protein